MQAEPERVERSAIRVVVAAGDAVARDELRARLGETGLRVVGMAADVAEAIGLVTRCPPDVVLLDAALPPGGGVPALLALGTVAPNARVVLLATSGDDEAGVLALLQGAAGYLPRDIDPNALARAVECAAAGEAAISRAMSSRLIERIREQASGAHGRVKSQP
jgi:two-component system, NarL family, response regulator LiaR